ncbi:hypothetical protein RhiirC2_734884 [Rhizophagus irregularis]|uniref:Uncharacterized protein n=1 Tax=Rhizophagus irregularis TaxID=588596 RepID=A0A2N1NQQ2_9GLOM|nr:hypothetical protein RhiirC2_734884 [Rhizophagus irregularis]
MLVCLVSFQKNAKNGKISQKKELDFADRFGKLKNGLMLRILKLLNIMGFIYIPSIL